LVQNVGLIFLYKFCP